MKLIKIFCILSMKFCIMYAPIRANHAFLHTSKRMRANVYLRLTVQTQQPILYQLVITNCHFFKGISSIIILLLFNLVRRIHM